MGEKAFTVWFTGLSGAGKSTLARALSEELSALSIKHQLLDGDELRRTRWQDLGFTREDRDENVRRIASAAGELNRQGVVAMVAAISPYREARQQARQGLERFVEVFVDCPLDVLVKRDPKGFYRRALAGEIGHFSGVSDPYEIPERPEIYVNSERETEKESLEKVMQGLRALGYLVAKLVI